MSRERIEAAIQAFEQKDIDLHEKSIVIDGLNASWFPDEQVLRGLHAGGVTAVNATVAAWHDPVATLGLLGGVLSLFDRYPDIVMPVASVADIHQAKGRGLLGLILGFQDTAPIAEDMGLLTVYHKIGIRVIQLTYNFRNRVGCGCQQPEDDGLTTFGRAVVTEMNRLGILLDISHCGPQTSLEAVITSETPVAITHANPRALLDHPRNKTDDLIKAVAERGGVIGVVIFGPMLTRKRPATLDDYLDAVDYLVNLVGIDHVGLGPDFMEALPAKVGVRALKGLPPATVIQFAAVPPTQGFESAAAFPNVTAGLLGRGCSPEDVGKIMGGNWLRLYEEVWL